MYSSEVRQILETANSNAKVRVYDRGTANMKMVRADIVTGRENERNKI
jgi:hypothetical protein